MCRSFYTSILFDDKKSIIKHQINKDIKQYNGVKCSVGLSLQFFKDEKDSKKNISKDRDIESHVLFLMTIM